MRNKHKLLQTILSMAVAVACLTTQIVPAFAQETDTDIGSTGGTVETETGTGSIGGSDTVGSDTVGSDTIGGDSLVIDQTPGADGTSALRTTTFALTEPTTAVPAEAGDYTIFVDTNTLKIKATDTTDSFTFTPTTSLTLSGGGEGVNLTIDSTVTATQLTTINGLTVDTLKTAVALKTSGTASTIKSLTGSAAAVTIANGESITFNGYEVVASDDAATLDDAGILTIASGKKVTINAVGHTATGTNATVDLQYLGHPRVLSGNITLDSVTDGYVLTCGYGPSGPNSVKYNELTYSTTSTNYFPVTFTAANKVKLGGGSNMKVTSGAATGDTEITMVANSSANINDKLWFKVGADKDETVTLKADGTIKSGGVSTLDGVKLLADFTIDTADVDRLLNNPVTIDFGDKELTVTGGAGDNTDMVLTSAAGSPVTLSLDADKALTVSKGELSSGKAPTKLVLDTADADAATDKAIFKCTAFAYDKFPIEITKNTIGTVEAAFGTYKDKITVGEDAIATIKGTSGDFTKENLIIASGSKAGSSTRSVTDGLTGYTKVTLDGTGGTHTIAADAFMDKDYVAVRLNTTTDTIKGGAATEIVVPAGNHLALLTGAAVSFPNKVTLESGADLILGGDTAAGTMTINDAKNVILKDGTEEKNTHLHLNFATVTTGKIKTGTNSHVEFTTVTYTGDFEAQTGTGTVPDDDEDGTVAAPGETINITYNDGDQTQNFIIGKGATMNITLKGTAKINVASKFFMDDDATLSITGVEGTPNTIDAQIITQHKDPTDPTDRTKDIPSDNVKITLKNVTLNGKAADDKDPTDDIITDRKEAMVFRGENAVLNIDGVVNVNGKIGKTGADSDKGGTGVSAIYISDDTDASLTVIGKGKLIVTGGKGGAGNGGASPGADGFAGGKGAAAVLNANKLILSMDAEGGFDKGQFIVTGGDGGNGGAGRQALLATHGSDASSNDPCTGFSSTIGGNGGANGQVGQAVQGGDVAVESGISLLYSGKTGVSVGGGANGAAPNGNAQGCHDGHSTSGAAGAESPENAAVMGVTAFDVSGGTVYARGGADVAGKAGIQLAGGATATATVSDGTVYAGPKVGNGYSDSNVVADAAAIGVFEEIKYPTYFATGTDMEYTRVKLFGVEGMPGNSGKPFKVDSLKIDGIDYDATDMYANAQGFLYLYLPASQKLDMEVVVTDVATNTSYYVKGERDAYTEVPATARAQAAITLNGRWGEAIPAFGTTAAGKKFTGVIPDWNPMKSDITTPQELASLAHAVNTGNSYAATGSYNLAGTVKTNDISGFLWTPIGNTAHPFKGTFNGSHSGGYQINGIRIENIPGVNAYGLFGNTDGAKISNLLLNNEDTPKADFVKTMANQYDPTTNKEFVSPTITSGGNNEVIQAQLEWKLTNASDLHVGAIVGKGKGTEISSILTQNLNMTGVATSGTAYVGGIAGFMEGDSKITSAKNQTTHGALVVKSSHFAGGIVGKMTGTTAYKAGNTLTPPTPWAPAQTQGIFDCTVLSAEISKVPTTGTAFATTGVIGGVAGHAENIAIINNKVEAAEFTANAGVMAVGGIAGVIKGSLVSLTYARNTDVTVTKWAAIATDATNSAFVGVYSRGKATVPASSGIEAGSGNTLVGSYIAAVGTDIPLLKVAAIGTGFNSYYELTAGAATAEGDAIVGLTTVEIKTITGMNSELTKTETGTSNDSGFIKTDVLENNYPDVKYAVDGGTPVNAGYPVFDMPFRISVTVLPKDGATVTASASATATITDFQNLWIGNNGTVTLTPNVSKYTWAATTYGANGVSTTTIPTANAAYTHTAAADADIVLTVTPAPSIGVHLGAINSTKGQDFALDGFVSTWLNPGTGFEDTDLNINSFAIVLEGAEANDKIKAGTITGGTSDAENTDQLKIFKAPAANWSISNVQAFIRENVKFNLSSNDTKINIIVSVGDLSGLTYANGTYADASMPTLITALNKTNMSGSDGAYGFNRASANSKNPPLPPATPSRPSYGGSGSSNGGVLNVDGTTNDKTGAFVEIPAGDYSSDLKLVVSPLATDSQQGKRFAAAVSDFDFAGMYNVDLLKGDVKVTRTNGYLTVHLPYAGKVGENYTVFRQNPDGTISMMSATYKDGYLVFIANEFCNYYAIAVKSSGASKPTKPTVVPPTGVTLLGKLF